MVVGMHRSGTSLITNWLYRCGLQIGEHLLEPGEGNVEGHFEDVEFLKIHEEILESKWDKKTSDIIGNLDCPKYLAEKYKITENHVKECIQIINSILKENTLQIYLIIINYSLF